MPASQKYPVTVNLRISDEMKAELEDLAIAQELSVAQVVRKALKGYLRQLSVGGTTDGL